MKSLKYYLKKAYREHWAIGQFNFSDFSELKGIVAASEHLKSPVILGTSEGESKFFGLQEAVALRDTLRKKTGLPIFLNLDHGHSFEYVKEAMVVGYDMVHFDGSKLSLEENIKMSREVLNFAKWRSVLVEGEVGHFATDSSVVYQGNFEVKEEDLTSISDAEQYIKKAKVDILAVNVGTFHGIDTNVSSPNIKLDRLKEISQKVKVPLVLHGGSGTPEADLKEAIKLGITKININTDIRVAFSRSLRESLGANEQEIVPYKYLPSAISAVQKAVEEKIKLFGSEDKV